MPLHHGISLLCLYTMVYPYYAFTPWYIPIMPLHHGISLLCLYTMVYPYYASTPWYVVCTYYNLMSMHNIPVFQRKLK